MLRKHTGLKAERLVSGTAETVVLALWVKGGQDPHCSSRMRRGGNPKPWRLVDRA